MTTEPRERLFLAVDLSAEARGLLAAQLDSWEPLPGRLVPPGNWHVTLRFLGWSTDLQRERLLGWLDERLVEPRTLPPFPIRFGALGAFPKPRRATVLWLGVDAGAAELSALAALCEEAAAAAGFTPEDRPFHPHLTLSRIRPPFDVSNLVDGARPSGLRDRVGAVTLFRSTLLAGGARYDAVERLALR